MPTFAAVWTITVAVETPALEAIAAIRSVMEIAIKTSHFDDALAMVRADTASIFHNLLAIPICETGLR